MRMAFESWEDAGVFYNAYAKQVGFGIRIRDVQKSRDCKIRMVKWVCAKQGYRDNKWFSLRNRKRKPRPITRQGCRAMIQVNLDGCTGKWIVKLLQSSHTHVLLPSKHIHLLPSHRDLKEGDKTFMSLCIVLE
ncbi:Protein FAR1-RELATED SEQUENCE 5 [Linum grandiflorum]